MTIGLIAHDAKKKLMQNFCIAYRGILSKNTLYATGTTGRLIEEVANLNIHKYLAGHLGGMQQMAAQIEHNEMDLVIFLRRPTLHRSGFRRWKRRLRPHVFQMLLHLICALSRMRLHMTLILSHRRQQRFLIWTTGRSFTARMSLSACILPASQR